MSTLIQSVGLGGLKPNTVLVSWPVHERSSSDSTDSEYNTFTGGSPVQLRVSHVSLLRVCVLCADITSLLEPPAAFRSPCVSKTFIKIDKG